MADVNRGSRPLSPHLQVYRPQITSVLSILHRVTGVGLALGALIAVLWFLAAATGPGAFATVDGLVTSILGDLVMLGSAWALAYHFCNGIRHLVWDTGRCLTLEEVTRTGQIALGASVALTILLVILA